VALQRAQEYANALEAYGNRNPMQLLDHYYELWRLDPLGLGEEDRRYLRILDQSSGAVGLERLTNQLGLGDREITRNVEPYLIERALVEVTSGGRRLTDQGKRYLRSVTSA
jgi:Holliday junction resolvasome RuvABC ATP-dependent DNA helicase subunit